MTLVAVSAGSLLKSHLAEVELKILWYAFIYAKSVV